MADYDKNTASRLKAIEEVFDRMIQDVVSVKDADGNARISDLHELLDKWNRGIKFGGSDVFDLAERLDVTDDWRKHLEKPQIRDPAQLPTMRETLAAYRHEGQADPNALACSIGRAIPAASSGPHTTARLSDPPHHVNPPDRSRLSVRVSLSDSNNRLE